jgi:hypothetical protein
MTQRSTRWYFRDWMSDQGVRKCSLAARGLWKDMLCLMADGQPYGHLTHNHKAMPMDVLAHLVGASIDEVTACFEELQTNEVFSLTKKGIAFSRRLIRDKKISKKNENNARIRWAHQSEKIDEIESGNAGTGRARARTGNGGGGGNKESSSKAESEQGLVLSPSEAIEAYHALADRTGLPKIAALTDQRRKKLKAILERYGAERWTDALRRLEQSDFCRGLGERGWRADFDFLVRPASFVKLLEGAYDNRTPSARGPPQYDADRAFDDIIQRKMQGR